MRWLRIPALALAPLAAALTAVWLSLEEYDRPPPGELLEYLFNPDYVVNAPIAYALLGTAEGTPGEDALAGISLPAGHRIGVFADDLPHVRMLHFTAGGRLFASQAMKGRVLRLEPDRDGDGRSDGVSVALEGLVAPHGLASDGRFLYVAERHAISRIGLDPASGQLSGELETLAPLPDLAGHGLRPLELGPDGWLYTAVGADCNACPPEHPLEGTILRAPPSGGPPEVVARGFRNVVDLAWHPESGELYATEVGRDFLGDDLPPDELDRIEPGGFYGFPWLHGDGLPDPELAPDPARTARARSPDFLFPAHSTPLGLTFLADGQALVALHGSWNRSRKSGYQVTALRWERDGRIRARPFASGFERDERVIGRPVDVVEGPDGAIYLSDDYAGAIYRIAGGASGPGAAPAPPR